MSSSQNLDDQPWWKDAVVYQIYPASFKDTNNDGIGDIPGITQSLDYIQSIGVDVLWICPMYASPQVDMGYDISDYKSVHQPYGTVQDMETLIAEAHRRGMRVILDLVINHTSDQHAWFQESKSSREHAKRDWYIWKPAKYDGEGRRKPPNNWRSAFGGSAWEWDEHTQEYYLHLFAVGQPDLNWENPETREAIYEDSMHFWLRKGVDGFRVDTVNLYSKDQSFSDAPVTDPGAELQESLKFVANGPRLKEFLSEMGAIFAQYNAMTVGECAHTPVETVLEYVGASKKRLNMIFQFEVVEVGCGKAFRYRTTPFAWELKDLARAIEATQSFLAGTDGWPTSFVENHDVARSVSRYGDDGAQWRERSAKLLATVFSSLSGTLFVYQGQEIGMINVPKEWPMEEYKDIESTNYYQMVAEQSGNDLAELRKAREALQYLARDNARTPMQWTAAPNAGFSDEGVETWMRVNPSAAGINVEEQRDRDGSALSYWREMLQFRREFRDVLVYGTFELVDEDNPTVLSFIKRGERRSALIVSNFSGEEAALPACSSESRWKIVMGNVPSTKTGANLAPWESRVYIDN